MRSEGEGCHPGIDRQLEEFGRLLDGEGKFGAGQQQERLVLVKLVEELKVKWCALQLLQLVSREETR